MSSGVVVLALSVVKFTPKEWILGISLIMLLISVSIILKFAPVETATKLLDKTERNYFRKKTILHLWLESIIISIVFLFELYTLGYIVCLGIIVSAMLVLLGQKNI